MIGLFFTTTVKLIVGFYLFYYQILNMI